LQIPIAVGTVILKNTSLYGISFHQKKRFTGQPACPVKTDALFFYEFQVSAIHEPGMSPRSVGYEPYRLRNSSKNEGYPALIRLKSGSSRAEIRLKCLSKTLKAGGQKRPEAGGCVRKVILKILFKGVRPALSRNPFRSTSSGSRIKVREDNRIFEITSKNQRVNKLSRICVYLRAKNRIKQKNKDTLLHKLKLMMKAKITLVIFTLLSAYANAQWSNGTSGTIYYNSGNVGIGTTEPLSKLTIQSPVASAGITYPLMISSMAPDAASGSGVGMSFVVGGNNTEALRAERARITVRQTFFGVRPSFIISTTDFNSPYTAFVDRFTINPLGHVGIGTTNPSERLTVFANGTLSTNTDAASLEANVTSAPTTNTTVGLNFNLSQGTNTPITYASIKAGEDTGTGMLYGSIRFLTQKYNSGSVLTEHMRLSSNGNLLVGKTSQTNTNYRVDVNGAIRTNEVVVNVTGADFVFDKSYELKKLEEVEKFIQDNKHLPGMESAQEMQKDGIGLGAMDMKLLQKVEELTLYIIDLKKELDKVKEQNVKLQEGMAELEKKVSR
jgi:hypothetical protein